jgi:hypothetical protein
MGMKRIVRQPNRTHPNLRVLGQRLQNDQMGSLQAYKVGKY